MTSKLKALGGCSSHHLQGVGAYCVGPTAGCTDCYILGEIGSGTMIQWTPVSLNWQHLAEVPSETVLMNMHIPIILHYVVMSEMNINWHLNECEQLITSNYVCVRTR